MAMRSGENCGNISLLRHAHGFGFMKEGVPDIRNVRQVALFLWYKKLQPLAIVFEKLEKVAAESFCFFSVERQI